MTKKKSKIPADVLDFAIKKMKQAAKDYTYWPDEEKDKLIEEKNYWKFKYYYARKAALIFAIALMAQCLITIVYLIKLSSCN